MGAIEAQSDKSLQVPLRTRYRNSHHSHHTYTTLDYISIHNGYKPGTSFNLHSLENECKLKKIFNQIVIDQLNGGGSKLIDISQFCESNSLTFTQLFNLFISCRETQHNAITLGVLYEHGIGTPKDSDLALQWYQKAADNGKCEGSVLSWQKSSILID
ncbi:6452_t:CDS:1 [Acaulospora morrowiae]|uniref:6452_t:CDS:1 n=1 Tax=Acaulospora morrowiae TaxID=94023 RepID=A0A9N8VUY9_9GLOM|nr:6452_t:CDS:1 [Acaulospora morrowiae]